MLVIDFLIPVFLTLHVQQNVHNYYILVIILVIISNVHDYYIYPFHFEYMVCVNLPMPSILPTNWRLITELYVKTNMVWLYIALYIAWPSPSILGRGPRVIGQVLSYRKQSPLLQVGKSGATADLSWSKSEATADWEDCNFNTCYYFLDSFLNLSEKHLFI